MEIHLKKKKSPSPHMLHIKYCPVSPHMFGPFKLATWFMLRRKTFACQQISMTIKKVT